jgi:hypothetical protein
MGRTPASGAAGAHRRRGATVPRGAPAVACTRVLESQTAWPSRPPPRPPRPATADPSQPPPRDARLWRLRSVPRPCSWWRGLADWREWLVFLARDLSPPGAVNHLVFAVQRRGEQPRASACEPAVCSTAKLCIRSRSPPTMKRAVDVVGVERSRIEVPADPLEHVHILGVLWILHHL